MMNALARFFTGSVSFHTPLPAHRPADLLFQHGITVVRQQVSADGYRFVVSLTDCKKTKSVLSANGVAYTVTARRGLLPFALRVLCRPGVILGFLAALFFLYGAMQHVWSIRVVGNERLLYSDVLAILKEEGFEIGVRHDRFDFHKMCNDIPLKHPEIAWISVNMMGAVAEVEVYETVEATPAPPPIGTLVNLIASRDGQIVSYRLSSGVAMVSVGQTVEKGQLLVAGYATGEGGLHPKVAVGEVYAEVSLYEEVFIPYTYSEKRYTGQILLGKTAKISEKRFIFSKNSRFSGTEYDTIEEEYSPTVFGIPLPIVITEQYARLYTVEELVRDEQEAEALARAALAERLDALGGQLSECVYFFYPSADGVRAVAEARATVNIAEQRAVELENAASGE